jgi:hypothetical protein
MKGMYNIFMVHYSKQIYIGKETTWSFLYYKILSTKYYSSFQFSIATFSFYLQFVVEYPLVFMPIEVRISFHMFQHNCTKINIKILWLQTYKVWHIHKNVLMTIHSFQMPIQKTIYQITTQYFHFKF